MSLLRKLLAIALLAVFGLPFASPLLALSTSAEMQLPACCRRGGAHRCGMPMAEHALADQNLAAQGPGGARFRAPAERCPYCPAALQNVRSLDLHAVPSGAGVLLSWDTHEQGAVQAEVRRRVARERARHTRGPPQTNLLA